MQPQNQNQFNSVTKLSKALAASLFIVLPFVGLYIGYTFAPEKVVELPVEKIVTVEKVVEVEHRVEVAATTSQDAALKSDDAKNYECKSIDSLAFESDSYFKNYSDRKTVTFTDKWIKADTQQSSFYLGCIGGTKELPGVDFESFSQIAQYTPVTIHGTSYVNQNPARSPQAPITPLAYDKNNFYINGNVAFSVASGTFEMREQDGTSNYYVRLGDEEFDLQWPIDMHLIEK